MRLSQKGRIQCMQYQHNTAESGGDGAIPVQYDTAESKARAIQH